MVEAGKRYRTPSGNLVEVAYVERIGSKLAATCTFVGKQARGYENGGTCRYDVNELEGREVT